MPNLIRDGGFSMWFILAFGGIALVTAFVFAARPDVRSERFIAWMGLATLGATLCGVASDIATTLYFVAGHEMAPDRRVQIAMQGTAESMAPAIVGFAILSLVALMVAVGKRRLDDRMAA
jgi:hypothetical protein